jgi:hypothetical protein
MDMQTGSRESRERRALNIVWTAAGAYGFMPDFLAFHRDGTPDIYLNSILGLAHRFYDVEKLAAYVRTLDSSLLHDTFTDILWLGIEQAVFRRELPDRPALAGLRREHARQYLQADIDASLQSLMLRREIIHTLKAGRCHEILGEPPGICNLWDKRLYEALDYPAELTTDEIIARTERILRRFFVFRWSAGHRAGWHISLGSRINAWLRRLVPHEPASSSLHRWRKGSAIGGDGTTGYDSCPTRNDAMAAIRRAFGAPLLAEPQRLRIERELCQGNHAKAQLYYAVGGDDKMRVANWAFWREKQAQYRLAMRNLQARLKECLSVYRQPLSVLGHKGRLDAGRVWRAAYLQDSRVFSAWQESIQADFAVTLLLDASESRQNQQRIIAAQAYVIAQSLLACAIPVQVLSFCSLHGVTVLCQLKSFAESDAAGVFGYAARGWNRDGLALLAAAKLLQDKNGQRQLLLVLTDANPSDELGLPGKGKFMSQRYMADAAIEDTAAAARQLRRQGVRLIGLVNSVLPGEVTGMAVQAIYGQDAARSENIGQLAAVVSGLIERQIQQSSG